MSWYNNTQTTENVQHNTAQSSERPQSGSQTDSHKRPRFAQIRQERPRFGKKPDFQRNDTVRPENRSFNTAANTPAEPLETKAESAEGKAGYLLHRSLRTPSCQRVGGRTRSPFYREPGNSTLPIRDSLRVIPVGGMEQVGGNLTIMEFGNDIIIIDMGMSFAGDEFPGADILLPDISYLEANKHRVRALIVTHGHLDHIGAVRYLLPKVGYPPVFAGKFAAGLMNHHFEEAGIKAHVKMHIIDPSRDVIKLGAFKIGCYRTAHSIPDGFGLAIKTPVGMIIWSGDFKFDDNPLDGDTNLDVERLKYLCDQPDGVLAAFVDSTSVEKPGHTPSERDVVNNITELMKNAPGRVIVSSFASMVMRFQELIKNAIADGRYIFISGRSMVNNINVAIETGTIKVDTSMFRDIKEVSSYPDDQVFIIMTGSQADEMAALNRLSYGEHRSLQVKTTDTIIFSSSHIPGNERVISNLMDRLCKLGADVIYHKTFNVHSNGHAQEDEVKRFYDIVKPKYAVPIHGEFHMLMHHKRKLVEWGWKPENVFLIENSRVLEFRDQNTVTYDDRIKSGVVLVHANAVSDIGESVIADRVQMSKSGMFMILIKAKGPQFRLFGRPEIITRGFVFAQSSDHLFEKAADLAVRLYENMEIHSPAQLFEYREELHKKLAKLFVKEVERNPLIMPVIIRC